MHSNTLSLNELLNNLAHAKASEDLDKIESDDILLENLCIQLSDHEKEIESGLQSLLNSDNNNYTAWNEKFVITMLRIMLTPPWSHYFSNGIITDFIKRALERQSPEFLSEMGQLLFACGEMYVPVAMQQEIVSDAKEHKNNLNNEQRLACALVCFTLGVKPYSDLKVPCYLSLLGLGIPYVKEHVSILDLKEIDSKAMSQIVPRSYLLDQLKQYKDRHPSIAAELGEIYYKVWVLSGEKDSESLESAIKFYSDALTQTENSHLFSAKRLKELNDILKDKLPNEPIDPKAYFENEKELLKIQNCYYEIQKFLPIAEAIIVLQEGIESEDLAIESILKIEETRLAPGTFKEQLAKEKKEVAQVAGLTDEQKIVKKEVEQEMKKADTRVELRQQTAMQLLTKPIRSSEMKGMQVEITKESALNAFLFLFRMQEPYAIQTKVDLIKENINKSLPYFNPRWFVRMYNRLPDAIRDKLFDDLTNEDKVQLLNIYLDNYESLDRMTRWPRDLLWTHLRKFERTDLHFIGFLEKLIAKIVNNQMDEADCMPFIDLVSNFREIYSSSAKTLAQHMLDKKSCINFINACRMQLTIREVWPGRVANQFTLLTAFIIKALQEKKLSVDFVMNYYKGDGDFFGFHSDQIDAIFQHCCQHHYSEMSADSRQIAYKWVTKLDCDDKQGRIIRYLHCRYESHDSILNDTFKIAELKYYNNDFVMSKPIIPNIGNGFDPVWNMMQLAIEMRCSTPTKYLSTVPPLGLYFSKQNNFIEEKKSASKEIFAEMLAAKKIELIEAAKNISPQWMNEIKQTVYNKFVEHLAQKKNSVGFLDELDAATKVGLFVGEENKLRSFYQKMITHVSGERMEMKGSGIEKVKLLLINSINRLRAEIGDQVLDKDFIRLRDPQGIKKKQAKITMLNELLAKADQKEFPQHLALAIKNCNKRTLAELKECQACLVPAPTSLQPGNR